MRHKKKKWKNERAYDYLLQVNVKNEKIINTPPAML